MMGNPFWRELCFFAGVFFSRYELCCGLFSRRLGAQGDGWGGRRERCNFVCQETKIVRGLYVGGIGRASPHCFGCYSIILLGLFSYLWFGCSRKGTFFNKKKDVKTRVKIEEFSGKETFQNNRTKQ